MKARPIPLVVVDTAEQQPLAPFAIEGGARLTLPTERKSLRWGDYSLPGLEDVVAIERKAGDFITTLFGSSETSVGEARANLDRFREELLALRGYAFRRIVIERHPRDIWREANEPGRRFDPTAAFALFCSLEVDYEISICWAADRSTAELLVGTWLVRIWRQHVGHDGAVKKAQRRGVALPWLRDAPSEAALEAEARAMLALEARRDLKPDNAVHRFAPAGGMPLTTSAAQQARRAAARCR